MKIRKIPFQPRREVAVVIDLKNLRLDLDSVKALLFGLRNCYGDTSGSPAGSYVVGPNEMIN